MIKYVLILMLPIFLNSQQKPQDIKIYDVYDFGAKGDGSTNDHDAIQKAIDSCNGTGGMVLFTKGKFLTGQLMLGSNMIINIDSSATLLGIQSDDEKDYPYGLIETKYPNRMYEDMQRRLLYGNHVENVTITGQGTIDGQGDFDPWMNVKSLGAEKDSTLYFSIRRVDQYHCFRLDLDKTRLLDTSLY